MRVYQGGTKMWCPHCNEVTVCAGINPSALAGHSGQLWYRQEHKDIQWFRRGRKCQRCGKSFLTAEVQEAFLNELVELRDALKDLKANAEAYYEQSKKAEAILRKLTEALGVLQSLKLYKKA